MNYKEPINNATQVNRVRRMKEVLCRYEQQINEIFEFVDKINFSLDVQHTGEDRYILRCNTVPLNPPRLILEYDSPTTCEGTLKDAVMHEIGGRVVAVIATGKGGVGKTCALRGLAIVDEIKNKFAGGILYIQLGNEAKISTLVAEIARVVEETGGPNLANQIRGVETVKEAALKAAKWFSRHPCLLLVDDIWTRNGIDSEVLPILGKMVNSSSRLVYTTRDIRFLSGIDKEIEFMEKETFGALSRRMLMRHAGFEEAYELDEKSRQAFEAILEMCAGLPLAFGIAGGVVSKYIRRKRSGEKQDAWCEFHRDIECREVNFLEASAEQYGKFSRIVDVSLFVLDRESENEMFCERFRSFCVLQKQQKIADHVLQKLWNMENLRHAQRLIERFEEVSIVQVSREGDCLFVELHDLILDIAVGQAAKQGAMQHFFRTLVDNYVSGVPGREKRDASMCTKKQEDERAEHGCGMKMLFRSFSKRCFRYGEGCKANEGVLSGQQQVEEEAVEGTAEQATPSLTLFHAWWKTDDDGFVHNNVCRMLRNASYDDGLFRLLSEPQWIVKRLVLHGIYSVEQDVSYGEELANEKRCKDANRAEHLDVVRRAARLSMTYVNENPREVWFQLHGRLLWHARRCELTRRFVQRIEQCAPRPWLRASEGLLQQGGGSAVDVVRAPGEVLCIHVEPHEIRMLWYQRYKWRHSSRQWLWGVGRYDRRNGKLKLVKLKPLLLLEEEEGDATGNVACASFVANGSSVMMAHAGGSLTVWDSQSGIRQLTGGHHCENHCRFIAFLAHGKLLACETHDHSIRLWHALSGHGVGQPLQGHIDTVTCVAVSADGTRIVSGSLDHTLRVWDAQSGKAVGQPLHGHTGAVTCVAISADTTCIVSGSSDNTVRVWDAESGHPIKQPLTGHTARIECIALSADGTCIVTGSADKTLRMWDGRSGHVVVQALTGHASGVQCVAVNADGTCLVSGSDDHTLRIWDAQSDYAVRHPHQDQCEDVRSVAFNANGTRIVTVHDKTLCVWDTESGHAVGPLQGHTDEVTCVAVSADGTRVVSGSVDKTTRVWDAQSGHAVGQPLRGHRTPVRQVAVSPDGTHIFSNNITLHILWALKAHDADCVLTSSDIRWQSTVDKLALRWSRNFHPFISPFGEEALKVTYHAEESEITLGTCDESVRNVTGSDLCVETKKT